jgi:hypothetical protein
MSALGIEPAEGYVAIEFLDGEDADPADHARPAPVSNDENEALMAMCVGVGKKVTTCKRGDTVLVRPYARNGIRVGDNIVLVEAYCVVGRLTAD